MTLSLSGKRWPSAYLIIIIGVFVVLWMYLASGLFLELINRTFTEATPATIYSYWYYYRDNKAVADRLFIAVGASLILCAAPLYLIFAPAKKSLFGDARLATTKEIEKAGLFGNKGIIVGKLGSRYLMFGGQQHATISAPTRSGKGVGIVIPNLLNWPNSVVVLDVKQENWNITSGYRKRYGQECFLFNPMSANYRTHRYNPLTYINPDPVFRIDDIQKIANMLFPDQPNTDVIWTATPRSLFLGIVLYLVETENAKVTLGQVLRESLTNGDGAQYFHNVIVSRRTSGKPLSSECVNALNSYISIASENTRSGVMTSFRSRLELWINPLVDAATSQNDFDLRDIRKRKMSIYLCVTPDNLERVAPLMNLFFQQLIDLNTRELPSQNKAIKHDCLLLMDEFAAIGKIPILSKGISYIAGYGLRLLPIIQSPSQLVEIYGKEAANNFNTNHALNIVFPPKRSDIQAAKDISEWLGYQTVKGTSKSQRSDLLFNRNRSESVTDQRRALLLPQEITSLGREKEIIVMEDVPPILANKVTFYNDKAFVNRLKEISPRLKKIKRPSKEQYDEAFESGELAASVPAINIEKHQNQDHIEQAYNSNGNGGATAEIIERFVVPEDMPNLAKLGLSSFVIDFSDDVEIPQKDVLNLAALHEYADNLSRQAGLTV